MKRALSAVIVISMSALLLSGCQIQLPGFLSGIKTTTPPPQGTKLHPTNIPAADATHSLYKNNLTGIRFLYPSTAFNATDASSSATPPTNEQNDAWIFLGDGANVHVSYYVSAVSDQYTLEQMQNQSAKNVSYNGQEAWELEQITTEGATFITTVFYGKKYTYVVEYSDAGGTRSADHVTEARALLNSIAITDNNLPPLPLTMDTSTWYTDTISYEGLSFSYPPELMLLQGGIFDVGSPSWIIRAMPRDTLYELSSIDLHVCPLKDNPTCSPDQLVIGNVSDVYADNVQAFTQSGGYTVVGDIAVGNTTGKKFRNTGKNTDGSDRFTVIFHGTKGIYLISNLQESNTPEKLFDKIISMMVVE